MTWTLLAIGILLVFLGRAHVQINAGVPPRAWLVVELALASGPLYGWFAHGQVLWAFAWAVLGALCFGVGFYVVRVYGPIIADAEAHQEFRRSLTRPTPAEFLRASQPIRPIQELAQQEVELARKHALRVTSDLHARAEATRNA